jgi:two-component system response regulator RegA
MSHTPASLVAVADPSEFARDELCAQFARRGWEVRAFADGKSMQRFLAHACPEVLVTELRLVDGPSIKLLQWVKCHRPDTRTVVVTGHGSVASAVQCMRLRADGYLAKPARIDQILGVLEGHGGSDDERFLSRPNSLDRALWEYINHAVVRAGSISEAARQLGLDRRSLRRMLGKTAPPTSR